jgi:tRNA (cmo5U34)-methyltransferase
MGNQWHFDPATYPEIVRAEIPGYDRLQSMLAEATAPVVAHRILDLGSGTGVTASYVLQLHPDADLLGIDSSEEMLAHARELLPSGTFVVGRLEDPLPPGPFDLIVSAFAVHHLDGRRKADLFIRIAAALREGGRFVICDVVIATGSVLQPVPLDEGFDLPSSMDEQMDWLRSAGLEPSVVFAEGDLCVLTADRPNHLS